MPHSKTVQPCLSTSSQFQHKEVLQWPSIFLTSGRQVLTISKLQ